MANLILNPTFTGTPPANWSASGVAWTFARDDGVTVNGTPTGKATVVAVNQSVGIRATLTIPAAGQPMWASMLLRVNRAGGDYRGRIFTTNQSFIDDGAVTVTPTTSGWTRLTLTAANVPASPGALFVYTYQSGANQVGDVVWIGSPEADVGAVPDFPEPEPDLIAVSRVFSVLQIGSSHVGPLRVGRR
jgi:hypothetical protein